MFYGIADLSLEHLNLFILSGRYKQNVRYLCEIEMDKMPEACFSNWLNREKCIVLVAALQTSILFKSVNTCKCIRLRRTLNCSHLFVSWLLYILHTTLMNRLLTFTAILYINLRLVVYRF